MEFLPHQQKWILTIKLFVFNPFYDDVLHCYPLCLHRAWIISQKIDLKKQTSEEKTV